MKPFLRLSCRRQEKSPIASRIIFNNRKQTSQSKVIDFGYCSGALYRSLSQSELPRMPPLLVRPPILEIPHLLPSSFISFATRLQHQAGLLSRSTRGLSEIESKEIYIQRRIGDFPVTVLSRTNQQVPQIDVHMVLNEGHTCRASGWNFQVVKVL